MKRIVALTILALIAMAIMVPVVMAAGDAPIEAKQGYFGMAALGCGLAIGLAALGTGIGMGSGLAKACEGVARNPGMMNKIMTVLIIGIAMIESLAIYALVVVLIIMFANPFPI